MMSACILPKLIPVEQYYENVYENAIKKPEINTVKKWAREGKLRLPTYKEGGKWWVDISGDPPLEIERKPRKRSMLSGSILANILLDK